MLSTKYERGESALLCKCLNLIWIDTLTKRETNQPSQIVCFEKRQYLLLLNLTAYKYRYPPSLY